MTATHLAIDFFIYYTIYYNFIIILSFLIKKVTWNYMHVKLMVASHILCLLCLLIVSGSHEVIGKHRST